MARARVARSARAREPDRRNSGRAERKSIERPAFGRCEIRLKRRARFDFNLKRARGQLIRLASLDELPRGTPSATARCEWLALMMRPAGQLASSVRRVAALARIVGVRRLESVSSAPQVRDDTLEWALCVGSLELFSAAGFRRDTFRVDSGRPRAAGELSWSGSGSGAFPWLPPPPPTPTKCGSRRLCSLGHHGN